MTEEDEDDIYAPDEGTTPRLDARSGNGNPAVKNEGGKIDEGEEEGEELEEEEEESDSVGATANLPLYNSLISLS